MSRCSSWLSCPSSLDPSSSPPRRASSRPWAAFLASSNPCSSLPSVPHQQPWVEPSLSLSLSLSPRGQTNTCKSKKPFRPLDPTPLSLSCRFSVSPSPPVSLPLSLSLSLSLSLCLFRAATTADWQTKSGGTGGARSAQPTRARIGRGETQWWAFLSALWERSFPASRCWELRAASTRSPGDFSLFFFFQFRLYHVVDLSGFFSFSILWCSQTGVPSARKI